MILCCSFFVWHTAVSQPWRMCGSPLRAFWIAVGDCLSSRNVDGQVVCCCGCVGFTQLHGLFG